MKKKYIFLIINVLLMCLPLKAQQQYSFIKDGIAYYILEGNAIVTSNDWDTDTEKGYEYSCPNYIGDITIPQSVTHGRITYPVTAMAHTLCA